MSYCESVAVPGGFEERVASFAVLADFAVPVVAAALVAAVPVVAAEFAASASVGAFVALRLAVPGSNR